MNKIGMLLISAVLSAGTLHSAQKDSQGWKTYRSEAFGYEISYPDEMELKAYFDGSSGDLKDGRTGRTLVDFEVWPPDVCPPQPASTTAKEVGIERAKTMTQADGPDGSSYCGDPVTVREYATPLGVKICELKLTCRSETYLVSEDDEADSDLDAEAADNEPIIKNEGEKGPTFFVDISQTWRKRVLMMDPVGFNPLQPAENKINIALLRRILESLHTFPVQKPPGICIEELQNRPFTGAVPR